MSADKYLKLCDAAIADMTDPVAIARLTMARDYLAATHGKSLSEVNACWLALNASSSLSQAGPSSSCG